MRPTSSGRANAQSFDLDKRSSSYGRHQIGGLYEKNISSPYRESNTAGKYDSTQLTYGVKSSPRGKSFDAAGTGNYSRAHSQEFTQTRISNKLQELQRISQTQKDKFD